MTADAETRADLIARVNAPRDRVVIMGRLQAVERGESTRLERHLAAALEEADRQLAELERGNRFRESVAKAEQERAVTAEAALELATDALEKIDEHSGSLMNVKRIAREALAAIRQEEKPCNGGYSCEAETHIEGCFRDR